MYKFILHKANTRGKADHGWLKSFHTFSFGHYYDPERVNFGALRVLNDDTIEAGMGFDTHPHQNMEIISIPLEGDLEHRDSMGNVTVIRSGDVQVMSAGTGIYHSEYNYNKDKSGKFLQIWIYPNKKNVTPRYDQISLQIKDRENKLQQILSPNAEDDGVWIYQNAWFYIGNFQKDFSVLYDIKSKENGVYFFTLKGSFEIANQILNTRDGFGIWSVDQIEIKSLENNSEILLMDVPMIF
ncbi:Quercetin 2,3-dioxygenase [uncultured Paludibacter sp.]|nr:Quercetin 2,3-dioxygenase [uncultured Paludibacter sp.]